MSNVIHLHNPWRQVANASDRIAKLVDYIAGWHNQHADESRSEMAAANRLMRQAVSLLERTQKREEQRWREGLIQTPDDNTREAQP